MTLPDCLGSGNSLKYCKKQSFQQALRHRVHHHSSNISPRQSEDTDRFSASPSCHALLHPIALEQIGSYLGENDIIRYSNQYARVEAV
jgi:hypothetical protein